MTEDIKRPQFYLSCRWSKREWENNKFGGVMLFLCKRAASKTCDVSICIRMKVTIKEGLTHQEESRIIELPKLRRSKN